MNSEFGQEQIDTVTPISIDDVENHIDSLADIQDKMLAISHWLWKAEGINNTMRILYEQGQIARLEVDKLLDRFDDLCQDINAKNLP